MNQFPLKSGKEKSRRDGSDNEVEETQSVITNTFQGQLKNEVNLCVHIVIIY